MLYQFTPRGVWGVVAGPLTSPGLPTFSVGVGVGAAFSDSAVVAFWGTDWEVGACPSISPG